MPYRVVKDFESALCDYTGAKYAVTTTSCTMALLLTCAWHRVKTVTIPNLTYVGVPQSIIHAGGRVKFTDYPWRGWYQLHPYPIFDCARRFTSNMYDEQTFQCASFHWSKILGLGQGGAILHDNHDADKWLRKARFDGRSESVPAKDDIITSLGWHCYMSPETAAQGLVRLKLLPRYNEDLPNSDYPDLSKMRIFR
jgi:dTDP-4-amino-4,6-dideoxygalactose transaminase